MIPIGKLVTGLLAALLAVTLITNAAAATPGELTEEINHCQHIRDVAHQMAECARELGYSEDHPAILAAQESWWKAMDQENELNRQLETIMSFIWDGPVLTKSKGVNYGPSGKETYYNLPMGGVIRIMRNIGFSEAEYPYWVRDDGVKMLGDFVIVAADLRTHPRGSIVDCSLGRAIVCDTGGFARSNPAQLDIAVSWQ